MKQLSQQKLRVMPFVFLATFTIITALMLIELAPKHGGWPYWDKVQHVLVFAALTAVGSLAFPQKKYWVYLALIVYGALIEWLQSVFTITRMASAYDWLADVIGILLAMLISLALAYYTSKPQSKLP